MIMSKLTTTLLEDVENDFAEISEKIDDYRNKLESSSSLFETDKYVENLIKSQRLLKKLSTEVNKSLGVLINQYY